MTTVPPPASPIRYPDNGELLEDASILRNAVHFSTKQRAYSAEAVLRLELDRLNPHGLALAVIDAYCAEMTTSEDLLGWLFVLRDWKPGTHEGCLFALLDKVQIGPNPWTEYAASELLDSLDEAGLRKLLHIPTDEELAAHEFETGVREAVRKSIPAHLNGFKRVVEKRLESERGYVVGFNKLKHFLLAMPTNMRGKNEVLVPHWRRPRTTPGAPAYDPLVDGITLQDVWIEASAEHIRQLASRAITGQAVLNSLLGIILWTRYGEPYENPQWTEHALTLPGWRDDDDP